MSELSIYPYILSGTAIISAVALFWTAKLIRSNPERWERLPRNVLWGMIIALIDLAVCIPQSKPLLPESLHSWLIPAAIVCAWATYQFLDYIFSRAFGGMLILLAHYLLHASFTLHMPGKPFYSLLLFAMGTLGIFFCGKPYLMRDFIRKIALNKKWYYGAVAVTALYTVSFAIAAVMEFVK